MVINFVRSRVQSRLSIIFCSPSRKFKILVIPNILTHAKSYEHGFIKKHDGHNLCVKSHEKSSFNRFFMHHFKNSKYWPFHVLAHEKLCEHSFTKKYDGHELCTKSRINSSANRFFMHRLKNLKYWSFPAMGSNTSTVSRKNTMVINFTQSQVSINFSCTISEIQNTGFS
ncbi:hypothetical protein GW17_00038754 [Ensete ventricosum]|nr:hypothetical protein GW17_00038754 [Ensete ventricosum]